MGRDTPDRRVHRTPPPLGITGGRVWLLGIECRRSMVWRLAHWFLERKPPGLRRRFDKREWMEEVGQLLELDAMDCVYRTRRLFVLQDTDIANPFSDSVESEVEIERR